MSCLLTKGKGLDCRTSTGGVKAAYFMDYSATLKDDVTADPDGTITDFPMVTAYKYVLPRGTSGFVQVVTTSLENGTTFFDGTVTVVTNGLNQDDLNELYRLVTGTPHVVLETQDGRFVLAGISNGLVAAGDIGFGVALGDRVGASLPFTTQEPQLAPFVEDFTNIANVTIVEEILT